MTHIPSDSGAGFCAAGSRTGKGGWILCSKETSHVAAVVKTGKALTGAITRSGRDAEDWRCGGGIVIAAAHSAVWENTLNSSTWR